MPFCSLQAARRGVVLGILLLAVVGGDARAAANDSESDSTQFSPRSSAFHPEAGRAFQRYVGPETYGATRQNWAAVQDSSGRFYVGNTAGVVLYDGHEWRTLPTANGSPAVSLAATADGQVYVGAKGDFGWIRPDSTGSPQYESLFRYVPKKHRSVGEIIRTVVANGDIYFQSRQRIFRWTLETHTMRVWKISGTEFQNASVVRDTLYVNVAGKGLMAVYGDSLQLVPGGEQLADQSVRFLLPHGDNGLLVGAFGGFLLRDGASFRPFRTDAESLLKDAWLYAGRKLRDGTIAVATIDRGLLLLAPDGRVRRHLQARGKPVTGLYEDREGGLWAILDGGLLRYDFGAPFTTFGKGTGLEGIVLDLTRHSDTFYAATTKAAYRLQTHPDTIASFERVSGLRRKTKDTPSWCLLSVGPDLLIGTTYGLVYRPSSGEAEYLFREEQVFDLIQSRLDSSHVYAASEAGIRVLQEAGDTWEVRQTIPFSEDPRMMVEGDDGQLWVGTSPDRVYQIQGLASGDSVRVNRFGSSDGLPEGPVGPFRWQGEVVFGTGIGAFRFRPDEPSPFAPLPALEPPSIGQGAGRVYVQADRQGHAWGMTGRGPGHWRREGGVWRWRPGVLRRLKGERTRTVSVEDGGRTVWFGLWKGQIVRHTPDREWERSSVSTLVHQAYAYDTDSLLSAAETARGPRTRGGIRITYGSPSLVQPQDIRYQYKMEGQTAEWSEWTARTEQTYRTLSPGRYTFAVRARLAYGDTTETARYAFTVPPPWYRTGWAYALFLLAAVGIVGGVVQLRTRQLRQRQETLETAVQERTEEIERQKEQLAEQAERLKELDEAKTRFFANVSHEFRTPITLILGPVQDLREKVRRHLSDEDVEQLNVVERNTQRLLRLVDRVLGIARMEAGSYRLDARPTDLPPEVTRIVRSVLPLADRNDLTLTVESSVAEEGDERDPVYVDRDALEHIVRNLLSNAIKFTPSGGTIRVTVMPHADAAEIAVADTGPGIPEDERAAVFDRFQQAGPSSGATTRPQEGAGIGLAFVRDLVDLHSGTIELDSTEGEGTTVRVRLPRGDDHFADAHLAESDGAGAEDSAESARPMVPERMPSSQEAGGDGAVSERSDNHPTSPDSEADGDNEQKKRILVVEDNADVRQYVRSILAPDFEVVEASNGEEGLEIARDRLPDVILADVMMPEMDGHEMTRRLKEDLETQAIPVIMVTARAGTGDEVEGLQVGADDYITKPFDADVLLQRVGGVITLQERLREQLRSDVATDEAEPEETTAASELEREARRAIREHLTDADFDADALADELAMSRSALYRAFKNDTDTTPSALITEVRMERAQLLLREDRGSVTQVAYAVGYERLSSFSRAFRSYAGQPPSAVTGRASAKDD